MNYLKDYLKEVDENTELQLKLSELENAIHHCKLCENYNRIHPCAYCEDYKYFELVDLDLIERND